MIYAKINEHKAAGRSRVVWLVALAVVTLVAAVFVTILILPRSGDGPDVGGVITYRSRESDFTVRPSGEQVATRYVEPAAQAATSRQGVWIAPDATTVAFVDQTDEGAWMAVWEPSGVTRLAQLTGSDSPPLVGQDKSVARAADGVPLLAAWSPDGSRLAYGTAIGGQDVFHVAESRAWSERTHSLSDGFVGELAWSSDGQHVAISSYSRDGRDHTVYVVAADGDGMTKLIDGCLIVWSPDSRYLAVHRDPYYEPGLWVFSIDGVKRHQLSDEAGATALAWLPE
ncbi:MAG: PD40 domain-containing protein [Chloroflexi bacterium]|nr:PD40 domain-containing protein [Chloroflexota bacterium]MCI0855066.1 PD40 domain-containing protein [Chloroflexota bacterium]MCI0889710.1 PD40 domain-containing protein [Chloroflexota bacterium]